jgi:hypothetical protein
MAFSILQRGVLAVLGRRCFSGTQKTKISELEAVAQGTGL